MAKAIPIVIGSGINEMTFVQEMMEHGISQEKVFVTRDLKGVTEKLGGGRQLAILDVNERCGVGDVVTVCNAVHEANPASEVILFNTYVGFKSLVPNIKRYLEVAASA